MFKTLLNMNRYRLIAAAASIDLFILCICWEWFLSPLRPGGSWLILKSLPLLFAIPGIWKGKVYTMQWASMLILVYMTEGLVRITETGINFWLALLETLFSTIVFVCLLVYLKPIKDKAKKLANQPTQNTPS